MAAALWESPCFRVRWINIFLTSCLSPSLLCFLLLFFALSPPRPLMFFLSSVFLDFFFVYLLSLQKSSGSELEEIMRRRQEKLAASTCDSGVESFDEGSTHWAPHGFSRLFPSLGLIFLFPPNSSFLTLLILRQRPTTQSLWRSCDAGRNSSARPRRKPRQRRPADRASESSVN